MSRVAGQVQFAARESVQIVQNAVDDNIADLEDLYELAVLHNKSVDSAFARTDGWQHPPPMVTAPIDKSEYANVTPRNDSGQYQKLDRQFPQSWYTSRKSQVVYVNDGEAPEIPVPKANHGFLSSILGGCGGRPLKPEVQVAQRVIQKPATIVDDPTSTFNIANAPDDVLAELLEKQPVPYERFGARVDQPFAEEGQFFKAIPANVVGERVKILDPSKGETKDTVELSEPADKGNRLIRQGLLEWESRFMDQDHVFETNEMLRNLQISDEGLTEVEPPKIEYDSRGRQWVVVR
eukprot:c7804_g1_i2.p1 GENE.c7804_g1_i2~~c7804_g1_i2.p1  ORF type:complete len:304 (+),score=55.85 c7804_g1_i2:34-912(+)